MTGTLLVWLLLGVLVIASAWNWIRVARRIAQGEPVLRAEPRPTEGVAVQAALLALVTALLIPSLCALGWLHYRGVTPAEYARQAATLTETRSAESRLFDELRFVDAIARLLSVIAVGTALHRWLGQGSWLSKLTCKTLIADLWIGLAAFVLIVPPVLLVKVGVSKLINASDLDEAHPLIHRIRTEPGQWTVFAMVGLSAVVAAPLYEELLFRQMIQGFLQRLDAWRITHFARLPHRSARRRADHDDSVNDSPGNVPTGYWPMLVSAGLFAGVHLGHGVDPLPLFLLGAGLGFLYRQKNRLLPCVVVHALLNGLTLLQLAAEAFQRSSTPAS